MFFLHILILYHLLEEVIFTLYYLYTTTTFLCAIFELAGMILMLRLGTILINAAGLFPNPSDDILGSVLGMQGWQGLQCILSVFIITGSVTSADAMIRRAFGF